MGRPRKNPIGIEGLLKFIPPARVQEIMNEALGGRVRELFKRNHGNTLGALVAALTGDSDWSLLKTISVSTVLQPAAGGGGAVRAATNGGATKGKVGRPRGRRSKLTDATLNEIVAAVEKHPGQRSEQLQKILSHLGPKLVKQGLAKLRADKRVRTSGERRATTYTPGK